MGANTKIEWADHTFNPWIGCTRVSPGCQNCYAETLDRNRFSKTLGGGTSEKPVIHWGPGAPRVRTSRINWSLPERWNARFEKDSKTGTPARPRVFCASLSDWLDPEVPTKWRHDLLDIIEITPNVEYLLLSKRLVLWAKLLEDCAAHGSQLAMRWLAGQPPKNVHLGGTVEDQRRADERRALMQSIPAEFYFVSYEPALELVQWKGWEFIDQLICGGESGPGARPMHAECPRMALDWCERSDVSFFFKQWGEWIPEHQEYARLTQPKIREIHIFDDGTRAFRVGKICAGRQLDGVEHNAMPVPF